MTAPRHFRLTRPQIQALIVVGIVVVVAGLIVAGVARLRQSAAQMQCRNNLKQLAISIENYQDTHSHLPPLADQGEGSPTGRGLPSVFAALAPYIEAYPWYGLSGYPPERYHAHSSRIFSFTAKGSHFDQEGGIANLIWHTFQCPSNTADKLRDVPVTLPDGSTGHYATGNYVVNGMLPWNKKGGTLNSANTILFAERPQVCRTAAGETVHTLWGVGFYSPQMPAFATLTPTDPPGLWCTGQVAPVVPLPDADGEVPVRIGWANAEPQAPDFDHPFNRFAPTGRATRGCPVPCTRTA